jgi:hypothetical protein
LRKISGVKEWAALPLSQLRKAPPRITKAKSGLPFWCLTLVARMKSVLKVFSVMTHVSQTHALDEVGENRREQEI